MRENDGIDIAGGNRTCVPIAQAQLFVALKQAAIDQQFLTVMLNAIFGTGDCVSTA
jgi:hypothetical protein